ncbi:MAG: hypothetical protein JNM94_18845 [Phycisphaerae bacterium]|nr:hypothetical protein [Phycisphaerae bacterium]
MQRRTVWAGISAASLLAVAAGCANRQTVDRVLVPGATTTEDRVVEIDRRWIPTTLAALRQSPGCLSAEAGQVGQKRAIFAMFRDKAATVEWYRSSAHQTLVDQVRFYRQGEHDPLAHVPDGTGPILVIASMTPTNPDTHGGSSQLLAVELFTPLDAGVRFGGASLLPRGDSARSASPASAGTSPAR